MLAYKTTVTKQIYPLWNESTLIILLIQDLMNSSVKWNQFDN